MSEHVAADIAPPLNVTEAAREIANGVTSAFVLLALMLPLGLLAFGAVTFSEADGYSGVKAGVRAAFAAAVFGNLSALVLGSPLLPNEVPRASTVFVFAGFIAHLAKVGVEAMDIVLLAGACLALSGAIQVAFGLLRLGNIARFVPYPVVAGLMTGLAISLIYYELPEVLGIHGAGAAEGEAVAHGASMNPWTVVLALFTIALVLVLRKQWPKAPSKMVGVAMGTGLAVLIAHFFPGADIGPSVPNLGGAIPLPTTLLPLLLAKGLHLVSAHRYELLVTAPTIAVIGSLDSLLAAVGESDGPLDTDHRPNRLLITLGLANMFSALFGGVPLAYSSKHSLMSHRAGALKILGSLVATLTLVALLLFGTPLLETIPVAVLSGIMVLLAFGLIDRWAGSTFRRARRGDYDRELWLNLLVVVIVAAVAIEFSLVPAVVTGLVLSMALFIAVMNRSLVRSIGTGLTRASRRVYPTVPASVLRAEGHRIRVMEIDGAIFFGTADRLASEALRATTGASYLILDLRRVTMIDASGALMLDRLSRRLRESGTQLLLSHVSVTSPLGRALQGAGVFSQKYHGDWFADTDRALEWTERQLLAQAHLDDTRREIRIGEFALMAHLSQAQLDCMKPYLDRQLFPARSTLFTEGDRGDRIYLLARGAVSMVAEDPTDKGKRRRVLTLAPGVMFGETAIVGTGAQAATAVAEEECVTYSLSRKSLDAIRAIDRDLYERLLLNMLDHVSGLLRMTAGVVREASDAVE